MRHTNFLKNRLSVAISMLLSTTVLAPVHAQEAQADGAGEVEVIEIQGIRGSLARSQDIKRGSTGVVDAISAEEMGKFPDTNLAESLQRITGVSVSRANNEGSQITVRGFGPEFNLVTLNGRQMAGTGFTRSFNFENLSSEGVKTLEIYKSARADVPTGGLGATVNIITNRPIASPGEKYTFMAKGIHDTSNETGEDVTPEFAGLYSNTFADDMFGVSVNFSYHRRDFQRQGANVRSWQLNPSFSGEQDVIDNRPTDGNGNPAEIFWIPNAEGVLEPTAAMFFPQEISFNIDDLQRERVNGMVTLQFAPTDDLIFTVDHTISDTLTTNDSLGWGLWNGSFGGNANAYELDENGTAIYYNSSGDDGSFTRFRETGEVDSKATGINIEWFATDSLNFRFDAHTSKTNTDNGLDKGLGAQARVILGSPNLFDKEYFFRTGDIPGFNINWANGSQEISANEIGTNFSIFTRTPGESEVTQYQFDGEWMPDIGYGLTNVRFGAAWTEQSLSGSGGSNNAEAPGFGTGVFAEIFPDSMFTRVDLSDFMDEFSFANGGVAPGYTYTFNLDEAFTRQAAYLTADVVGSDVYEVGSFGPENFPVNRIDEETLSLYVSTSWEFEISDYYVDVNLGLRYEETDVVSPAKSRVPELVYWASGSEWITQFASGGEVQEVEFTGNYDLLLPMLDIKLDITDELVGRFSTGQTITRPTLGNMLGFLALTPSPKIGSRTGSRGNPNLKPFKSTNLDLSLEYYYDDASYAAIGLFWKDVEDWIDNTQVTTTFEGLHDVYLGGRWNAAVTAIEGRGEQATDAAIFAEIVANGVGIGENNRILPDPATDPLIEWTISSPENVGSRKVNGLEFAVQHVFGDSGFGTGFNMTLVDGDVEYDNYILAAQAILPGLSNSANWQGFYEKDGLSVKLTAAWRDEYLIAQGQPDTSDAPPQYFEEYLQWDLSVNYDVTDNLTVFFEGINLTNETERRFGRFERQFLSAAQYGPRYALGVRYSFSE
ncbi:TonB-dependent receptor [Aestuariibacter salexigens]|uniref:TonB-dependent receptor n=1 Tax=Aestuariibacter salexigens TaxID=226010 RepID=UPI0004231423|nr:TonB-dependent receptor [Aestuariibacter salexigens]